MKSWTKPTDELVARAIASTTDSEQRRYFFYKLENPLWVQPLWEKDFFKNPPEPLPTGDGGFQIAYWPESQYLVRVAKDLPDVVAEIASKIRTGNPRVLEDIIDIALAVDSSDVASKLYKQALAFAENKFAHWGCQKLGKLVAHWARLGARSEALNLADRLVRLRSDPKRDEKAEKRKADSNAPFTSLKPHAPYDIHAYKTVIEEDVVLLVQAYPWDATQMLIQALAEGIAFSLFEPDESKPYDRSDLWCHHMRDADKYEHDAKSYLAHALTNACEILLQKEPERIQDLDKCLRCQSWHFFNRLRWYLYARFPDITKTLMKSDAVSYGKYDDGEYGFEFASMLQAVSNCQLLDDNELVGIFKKIESGPDIEGYKNWLGDKITEDQIQGRREYFFIKQLFPFELVLHKFPEYWEKYQGLVQNHGAIKLSDYFKYRIGGGESGFVQEKSPITVEILLGKTHEELLEFLNQWKPASHISDFRAPNISGLAKVLSESLIQQPDRFLAVADRMALTNPTYVRDFLYFLVERAKQKQSLPWEKVIVLCEWVVGQPSRHLDPNQDNWRNGEPDFTTCRQTVAGLFQHGSHDYPHSIPWALRERIFPMIKSLSTDYDNRLEHESFGSDHLNHAINSVRGEAAQALVDHAFWIKRNLKLDTQAMAKMPEVQLLLESRLDSLNEKSHSVHAVFALLTPQLCQLDSEWLKKALNKIFPAEHELFDRWIAAWKTFVIWNQPYGWLFNVLKEQYGIAIERLDALRDDDKSSRSAIDALGEHLITFYWWGLIPLTGGDSSLEKYLVKANAKERAHLINYIGRVMENSQDLPKEVEIRFMEYWQHRFEMIKQGGKYEEASEELSDFAWWFRPGKLDKAWCLKQLQELLNLTPQIHETHFLLESLARVSVEFPFETANCLRLIVGKITKEKYVYLDEKSAKEILNVAINSKQKDAANIAQATKDTLLRMGRFEYKDIIECAE
jgi:hypothetical protein